MNTTIYMIVSGVVAVGFCGLFLISYFKSKDIYNEYIEDLDKKEYPLKDFFPMGLWMNEKIDFSKFIPKQFASIFGKYKMQIKGKVIELYGLKYSDYYMMIHNANKSAMSILISALAALAGFILAAQGDSTSLFLSGIAVAGYVAMPFVVDKGLDDKIQERRLNIQLEFPDFITKLTLLVNAGMTISKAWEKIVTDVTKKSMLYDEMKYTLAEIHAGKSEPVAYEEFGRRCKIKEIIKFVSVIILNLKKGGAEVVPVLRVQGNECWEMRKSVAKRLGEEASTKILIPLMIMLVGIIVIVATPAILSFSSGM